jgi:hypothetical protein
MADLSDGKWKFSPNLLQHSPKYARCVEKIWKFSRTKISQNRAQKMRNQPWVTFGCTYDSRKSTSVRQIINKYQRGYKRHTFRPTSRHISYTANNTRAQPRQVVACARLLSALVLRIRLIDELWVESGVSHLWNINRQTYQLFSPFVPSAAAAVELVVALDCVVIVTLARP